MARNREAGVMLPKGVHAVKRRRNGRVIKTDYYFAPGRGTKRAGERTKIPYEPREPEFWAMIQRLEGGETGPAQGSFNALISSFRCSPEWQRLRPATKRDYDIYLTRLLGLAGDRMVAAMMRRDVYQLRDIYAATPVAANHLLSILRTLIEYSVTRGYRDDNPVVGVKRLRIDSDGARPWPEDVYRFVLDHAPEDLRRTAILGRATGQRCGDLVRMGPRHRLDDGITVHIGKLREKEYWIPLLVKDIAEIDGWGVRDLDLYIKSPTSRPYRADGLNSRWNRWRNSDAARPIRDIKITLHGLRATAVCDRRLDGLSEGQVSKELGMSAPMVAHYAKHADQKAHARQSRDHRLKNRALGTPNEQNL